MVDSGNLCVTGWVLSEHTTLTMLVLPLGLTQNKDTCRGFRVLVWISNPLSSRWGSPKPAGGKGLTETSRNLRKQERVTGSLARYSVCWGPQVSWTVRFICNPGGAVLNKKLPSEMRKQPFVCSLQQKQ